MSIEAKRKKKPEQRTDKDWQGIWDARSLADAQTIQADPARLKEAQEWAAVLVEEEQQEAESMKTVAGGLNSDG